MILGNNLWVGPRQDEFCDQYWWCRKGLINWPNFAKTELLKQQIDEKGCVTMSIDIIKATVTPVDERGIALVSSPKRLPSVLATQSAAQLHSIALGGGFHSTSAKVLQDYEIEVKICGEYYDDAQLKQLIKRYISQTHLSIENNPFNVSSRNAESPRASTLRPRTVGGVEGGAGRPSPKNTRGMQSPTRMDQFPASLADRTGTAQFLPPRPGTSAMSGSPEGLREGSSSRVGRMPPLSPQRSPPGRSPPPKLRSPMG